MVTPELVTYFEGRVKDDTPPDIWAEREHYLDGTIANERMARGFQTALVEAERKADQAEQRAREAAAQRDLLKVTLAAALETAETASMETTELRLQLLEVEGESAAYKNRLDRATRLLRNALFFQKDRELMAEMYLHLDIVEAGAEA
jgi:hypothetical protein